MCVRLCSATAYHSHYRSIAEHSGAASEKKTRWSTEDMISVTYTHAYILRVLLIRFRNGRGVQLKVSGRAGVPAGCDSFVDSDVRCVVRDYDSRTAKKYAHTRNSICSAK